MTRFYLNDVDVTDRLREASSSLEDFRADEERLACSTCGELDTVELCRGDQCITICATCGSDEP